MQQHIHHRASSPLLASHSKRVARGSWRSMASETQAPTADAPVYDLIKDIEVTLVGPNTTVPVGSLWSSTDRCILFFGRHMG